MLKGPEYSWESREKKMEYLPVFNELVALLGHSMRGKDRNGRMDRRDLSTFTDEWRFLVFYLFMGKITRTIAPLDIKRNQPYP